MFHGHCSKNLRKSKPTSKVGFEVRDDIVHFPPPISDDSFDQFGCICSDISQKVGKLPLLQSYEAGFFLH